MKQCVKRMLKNESVNEKELMNILFKTLQTPNYLKINISLLYDKVITDQNILDRIEDTTEFKIACVLASALFMYDLHCQEFILKQNAKMFYHHSQINYRSLKILDIHDKILDHYFKFAME